MRTKFREHKRRRTKFKSREEEPRKSKRTKMKKRLPTTCPQQVPCGGCTPNPPTLCDYHSTGYCGAPCVEIALCAHYCKTNFECEAYHKTMRKIQEQREKDTALRMEIMRERQKELEPRPAKKESKRKSKRTKFRKEK